MSNNSKPKIVGTTKHTNGPTKYTLKYKKDGQNVSESINAATLLNDYKKNALSNDNTTKNFYAKAEANKAAANAEANKAAANKAEANKAAANKAAANKAEANKAEANKAEANKAAANKAAAQSLPNVQEEIEEKEAAANGSSAAKTVAIVPPPPPLGPKQLAEIKAKKNANAEAAAKVNVVAANAAVAAVNAAKNQTNGKPLDPASQSTSPKDYFTVTDKDGDKYRTSIYNNLEDAKAAYPGLNVVHIVNTNGQYSVSKSTNVKGGRTRRSKKVQRKSKTQRK